MSKLELTQRLLVIANRGLAEANRGNIFWTQADAMRAINNARNISKLS